MKKQNKYYNGKYRKKLKQLANIELTEAVLSRQMIEALYSRADLILLPYDPNVYHFRGSGIHYEAIENKIPVLAKKGAGFAEEINNWSSGWLYETKQDVLQCLEKILAMNPDDRRNKMEKAFTNYKRSFDEAYHFNLS